MTRARPQVTLTLSNEAIAALETLAAKRGLTRSALIEALAADALGLDSLAGYRAPRARKGSA